MRDIIVFAVVMGFIPFILMRPAVGILVWSWLGYMNPHRLTWGFAYSFPFAQLVGVATLAGFLFQKDKGRLPITSLTVLLMIFVAWMTLSTVFSLNPDQAWIEWDRTIKIQVVTFLTMLLMQNGERIKQLIWVIALSLGFYGVKGGIFSIATGGNHLVWGPPETFIGDNNTLALALLMTIPLMRFCQMEAPKPWMKHGMTAVMLLSSISILVSHSRGALVGIVATLMFVWWKSRRKLIGIGLVVLALPFVFAFLPDHWFERMSTIQEYDEDASAMGRINAWWFAFNLAVDRPLVGGGFRTFKDELFLIYAPNPEDSHDAHSIYFEVLAEHGFVGLGLFLAIGLLAVLKSGKLAKMSPSRTEDQWIPRLAAMLQISFVSYATTGAFLGLAYFDLYYQLLAVLVVVGLLAKNTASAPIVKPVGNAYAASPPTTT